VRVSVAVLGVNLSRDLDPAGDTDLLIEAQAAALGRNHTQGVRTGPANVSFRWVVDVPDVGPWRELRVPVALTFWDLDLAGDDAESGVTRQPLRLVGDGNVLVADLDVFQRRWTAAQGLGEGGEGAVELRGTDGTVRLALQASLE
jgi:hypothetical protein